MSSLSVFTVLYSTDNHDYTSVFMTDSANHILLRRRMNTHLYSYSVQ